MDFGRTEERSKGAVDGVLGSGIVRVSKSFDCTVSHDINLTAR